MSLAPLPSFPLSAHSPRALRATTKRTSPKDRGWGEPCKTDPQVTVRFAPRPRDGRVFTRLIREELAPLVKLLVDATQELGAAIDGYEIRTNEELGGGFSTYNCRIIKGGQSTSWHSWPVALDINAKGNPMTPRYADGGTFISRQPPWMVELWERSGFEWGGRYGAYADSMHFGYLYRPTDVATDLANARAAYADIRARLAPADPHTPEEPTVTPDQVKKVQQALNQLGASPPLDVDGKFGAKTEAAVSQVVAAHKALADLAKNRRATLDTIKAAAAAAQ